MSPTDPFGLIGQVLDGQFKVEALVGEGGFSVVYRGQNVGLNEPIAIKCLKLPPSVGPQLVDTFAQRFRDESRILYRLSQGNLNIVRSMGAGTAQIPQLGIAAPYMVLEWLEGRSLATDFASRRAASMKGRSLDEVLQLFASAADALGFAHAQGVIHRDLNPGNLFFSATAQGEKMKVLDFGVAKIMHDSTLGLGPRAVTMQQIRIFAPAYGAPEQFDDGLGAVGPWTDVYAFALVLLEALRDRSVQEGENLADFAQAAVDPARRPTPRGLGLSVSDEIEQVFARATKLDPRERWQSVAEFWRSLGFAVAAAGPQAAKPSLPEKAPLSAMGATLPLGSPMLPRPGAPRPAAGRAPSSPAIDFKKDASPSTQRFGAQPPSALKVPSDPPPPMPAALEDEPEEVTRVHAPAPQMLEALSARGAQVANPTPLRPGPVEPAALPTAPPAPLAPPAPVPAAGRPAEPPKPPSAPPPSLGGTMAMVQAPVRPAPLPPPVVIPEPPQTPPMIQQPLVMPPSPSEQMQQPPPPLVMPQAAPPPPQMMQPAPMQHAPAPMQQQQPGLMRPSTPGAIPPPPMQNMGPLGPIPTPPPMMVGMPSMQTGQFGGPSPYASAAEPAPSGPKSNVVAIVAAAFGLVVLLGIGGAVLMFRGSAAKRTEPVVLASSVAPPAVSAPEPPPAVVTAEPAVTAQPSASASAEPEPEPVASAEPAPSASAAPSATSAAATPSATTTATVVTTATWAPPSATPPKPSAAPVDPNAFNEPAARARLGQANGVLVFCKRADGVTGPGNASVTFANDGSVSGVVMDPPYAGTKEGDCVAGHLKRAKISAFEGPPKTLRHVFQIPK